MSGSTTAGAAVIRPRHFPCFDGLRAIAAVLVVMVHTAVRVGVHAALLGRHLHGPLRDRRGGVLLDLGVPAVPALRGVAHRRRRSSASVGKFWVRRFLRIIPAYWLAFVVTNYVMHIDTKVHPGWHSLLIYLGLAQVYIPSHALTGITQAWSLCTEIAFYLFLPLYAMFIVARARALTVTSSTCELVGVAGLLYIVGLGLRFWLLHVHSPLASSRWNGSRRASTCSRSGCCWRSSAAGSPTGSPSRGGCGTRPCPGSVGRVRSGMLLGRRRTSGCRDSPLEHNSPDRWNGPRGALRAVRVLPSASGGLRPAARGAASGVLCGGSR